VIRNIENVMDNVGVIQRHMKRFEEKRRWMVGNEHMAIHYGATYGLVAELESFLGHNFYD
jgi:hypothetical protein